VVLWGESAVGVRVREAVAASVVLHNRELVRDAEMIRDCEAVEVEVEELDDRP
jgi:hypothetical protein